MDEVVRREKVKVSLVSVTPPQNISFNLVPFCKRKSLLCRYHKWKILERSRNRVSPFIFYLNEGASSLFSFTYNFADSPWPVVSDQPRV